MKTRILIQRFLLIIPIFPIYSVGKFFEALGFISDKISYRCLVMIWIYEDFIRKHFKYLFKQEINHDKK